MKIFKFINDMSNVRRWSHAYCHKEESVLEHTAVVSILALAMGSEVGADMATLLEKALLHDMEEVITGDIPNPTKYHNPKITKKIKQFEDIAASEVADKYFGEWAKATWACSKDGTLEGEIIRIADIGAVAYKIQQEIALGNNSFSKYEENVWNSLHDIKYNLKNDCLLIYIHDIMDIVTGAKSENS
jgi:5'-deoxynucleotidase